MIKLSDIRNVHLEISSKCNASCPFCRRNFQGYPFNDGYLETNLTLDQTKKIFNQSLLSQLTSININGNFGDIVMNHEGADIVEYFRESNPDMEIYISTNGSARSAKFWQRLARAGSIVSFCLDGMEDTHPIYRQGTSWKTIINNATTFIQAGGKAIWKFIVFDHNKHQIQECNDLANSLGFRHFDQVNDGGRVNGPAFDKRGNLKSVIGTYDGITEFKVLFHKKVTDLVLVEDITRGKAPSTNINYQSIRNKSIYVAANGEVSPCCWTGFSPKTYGHGEYHQAINSQLSPLITNNNALEHGLEKSLQWFNSIENAWSINNYKNGRLVVCDDSCGY